MLEILFCSLLTIFPDYLFRRYVQGRRLGHEITIFSVWYELRWGIVTCMLLAVSLITLVFFFHPSSTAVISIFRTVPIVPQITGRVAEIFVRGSEPVAAGAPLFRLADETQRTAVETARRAIAQVDASLLAAQADLATARARVLQAEGELRQATDELDTKRALTQRNYDVVSRREVERLEVLVQTREAGVAAARAGSQAVEVRISDQLPAERASAVAALAQAQVELDKTVIRAGEAGRVEQFLVQVGDLVNPMFRPAGVLVPEGLGIRDRSLVAGFPQLEAGVLQVGMIAEVVCGSRPWTVIPMVVTHVQGFVAGGQLRGTDRLLDPEQFRQPGTILTKLEPLYEGGLDGVIPGGTCIANAYSTHLTLAGDRPTGGLRSLGLHVIEAVGIIHAVLLRIQALLMPFKTLVFSGGH